MEDIIMIGGSVIMVGLLIAMVVLSVMTVVYYRKAHEPGALKRVIGIWLTWIGIVFFFGLLSSAGIFIGALYVGIFACLVSLAVAVNGMKSGKAYLENYRKTQS